MAPFLDESLPRRPRTHRRPRLPPDAAGARHRGRAGARGGRPSPPRRGIDRVAGGERPRSVLVASLGGSARRRATCSSCWPSRGRRCRSACGATCRCPAGSGRWTSSSRSRCPGRARGPVARRGRGRPPRRVPADRRCGRLAAGRRRARARGVHIDVGRGRTSSRTALWSLLTPVLLARRRASAWSTPASRCSHDTADRLDEHAEACRPSLGVLRQPGQGPRHRAGRARSRWSSATGRSTASPPAGPPRCWRGPPACRRPAASCPTPPRRSWRRFDGPFTARRRPGRGPARGRRRTSSPTRSSTGRPSRGSAC